MSRVSVVIPTRDRAALLARTVASVRAQAEVELELIVVVDGGRDDTRAMLAALDDPRIVTITHDTPRGVSSARNRGMDAATGTWIAFLDDDDLWGPHKLARQLGAMQAAGRQWAFSGSVSFEAPCTIVAGSAPPAGEAVCAALPVRNCVPAGASNVIVHRDLLHAAGGFDPTLRHMADWDLWMRLAQRGLPAMVPMPDVAYRLHTANASADADVIEPELAVIAARHSGADIDRAFVLRWVAWNQLRVGARTRAARTYLRAAGAGDALSVARAAVALLHPDAVHRRMRSALDARWAADAQAWLCAAAGMTR